MKRIKLFKILYSSCVISRRSFILGIESSCDDTGAALIDNKGNLLGECLSSQRSTRYGGVIPSFAMGFHAIALPHVVGETLKMASVKECDIDAIAITTKPGLSGSLSTGVSYAQYLSRTLNKPLIPVHHMEAHALTARMVEQIDFPFMVMLVSGGHCLIAIAQDIDKFSLLGQSKDNSPGEVIDKIARRLRLHTVRTDLRDTSGGKAVEIIAKEGNGNPLAYLVPLALSNERSCNFSFSGIRSYFSALVEKLEEKNGTSPDNVVPEAADICASLEHAVAIQLSRKLQRAFVYAEVNDIWMGMPKTLVVSGGVACNNRIRSYLRTVSEAFEVNLVAPEAKYCTDNGVMIAWNGLEKWRRHIDIVPPSEVFGPSMSIFPRAPFGTDISDILTRESIKCKWIKESEIIEQHKLTNRV